MEPISVPRTALPDLLLDLDAARDEPMYRQLYQELRSAIVDGRLAAGTRLPPTRTLASSLGVSRNTVLTAFAQLVVEGYATGRRGDGTRVAAIPARPARPARATPSRREAPARTGATRIAPPSRAILPGPLVTNLVNAGCGPRGATGHVRAFATGVPALHALPLSTWQRLVTRRWRGAHIRDLGYQGPEGAAPLREALAALVSASRAVRCSPHQVIVTSGTQQAVLLAALALLAPGDSAWLEDPGYHGARWALTAARATIAPIPVDADGLMVDEGIRRAPKARLAYVTPSHQHPTGATMSAARRMALLAWAERSGMYVLEDDYNSELRLTSKPLPSLQGLDRAKRVLYVGTMSKVFMPAVRIGYIVVPEELVDAFRIVRASVDWHPPAIEQLALADFITEGHYARHLRRMRALYAERRECLIRLGDSVLADVLEVQPDPGGLHMLARLRPGVARGSDVRASQLAHDAGVDATPISPFCLEARERGLLLGYAGYDERVQRHAAEKLARALR